jgi:metal-responsive CopG/Arc/MetJ family transcriptional regulator
MVYSGMKTAVSIPDELFAAAEALAAKLQMSRSRLVAVALAEYLARHRAGRVTERLDAVYAAEESRPDTTVRAAGARTLRRADW